MNSNNRTSARTLVSESAGNPYGHVPGHYYHDAEIRVTTRKRGGYLATVTVVWGSCQGYDEEHGRLEASARGSTPEDALDRLHPKALALGAGDEACARYVQSALSKAEMTLADLEKD